MTTRNSNAATSTRRTRTHRAPRASGPAPVRLGIIGLGGRTEVLLVSLFAIEGVEIRPNSRLSCQIQLGEELDGLRVSIPPDQPGV